MHATSAAMRSGGDFILRQLFPSPTTPRKEQIQRTTASTETCKLKRAHYTASPTTAGGDNKIFFANFIAKPAADRLTPARKVNVLVLTCLDVSI